MTQQTDITAEQPKMAVDGPHFRFGVRKRDRKPMPVEFHGAWLGAGAGATVGAFIIGLITTYVTHKALPAFLVTGIDGLCAAGLAALGSWLTHVTKGIL